MAQEIVKQGMFSKNKVRRGAMQKEREGSGQ